MSSVQNIEVQMIEYVQIGASQKAESGIDSMSPVERDSLIESINHSIQVFLQDQLFSHYSILTFCDKIATIFGENMVASHFVSSNVLVVFVDSVSPDTHSKFLYIPQSTWIQ